MGLALGVGAHMVELRRTRSGAFSEKEMHSLHDIQDASIAAKGGDSSAISSMVLSVDAAVPDLPTVIVRDTAVDALCHGAVLAGVGVICCDEFKKDQTVAVLSQKKEFICLGKALVSSISFKPGETGFVIAPTTVFLPPGTYPRAWSKSETVARIGKENVQTRKKRAEKKIPLKKYPVNK
jgi:tRNA pseudouridine55 synthase/H/ACA ribonucleoprotein complex subunit 4